MLNLLKLKMMKNIFVWMIFLQFSSQLFAQKKIEGFILDAETNQGLPFAHIAIQGTNLGTVSNAEGYFYLDLKTQKQLGDSVIFSYMGFQDCSMALNAYPDTLLNISLKAQIQELEELTITTESPLEIVQKAFDRVGENYPTNTQLLQGFFRETVQQNSVYLAYTEAIVNIKKTSYSALRADDLIKIEKARSKADPKKSEFLDKVNFRGGLQGVLNMDIVKKRSLFDEKSYSYFDFQLEDIQRFKNKWIYIIQFTKKAESKKGGLEGKFFIEADSYAFVRIELARNELGLKKDNKFGLKDEIAMKMLGLRLEKKSRTFMVDYRLVNGKWVLFSTKYTLKMDVVDKKEFSQVVFQTYLLNYEVKEFTNDAFNKSEAAHKNEMTYKSAENYQDENFWLGYHYPVPSKVEQQLIQNLNQK